LGLVEDYNAACVNTTITIPSTFFTYPGAYYYHVGVYVYPERGPRLQAGATGNMTGTIKGFLNAEGDNGYTQFYVGTPPKSAIIPKMEHNEPNRQERMNKYLKVLTGQ